MSTSLDLIDVLKLELKEANVTYAELAQSIGMAESSVKRIFAKGDTSLAKIDEICKVLKLDFSDIARKLADQQTLLAELSLAQEAGLIADKRLLLVAICVLSQWTLEQMTEQYLITQADCIRCMAQLDRLGIIELRPMNRYQLKLAKTFKWRPHGPIMTFFRENALLEYFSGGFSGEGEGLLLVHGSISKALAPLFFERLQRVAQDFSQQHLADQKVAEKDRQGYTLVLGMRSWEFEAFKALRR
jgi:DNA-binding Xre family transcriptional regulator